MTFNDGRLLKQLVSIDNSIDAAEGEGIEARWKFGLSCWSDALASSFPRDC